MKVETAWYECGPYLHALIGTATILYAPGTPLMKASGLILLSAALTIIGMRWIYRHDLAAHAGQHIDPTRYVALITQDLFYDDPRGSSIAGRSREAGAGSTKGRVRREEPQS